MQFWKTWIFVLAALPAVAACNSGGSGMPDGGGGDGDVDRDADTDGGTECIDRDEDGFGDGCAMGPDCDDDDVSVHPEAAESCNASDDDCDGTVDESLEAPRCPLTEGVCAGARARCDGDGGWLECTGTDYGDAWEADETLCDSLDNDCDGSTDEGCTCTPGATQSCGSDVGACESGTQTCLDSESWGPCEDDAGPMGETCDGLDNDCDGDVDESADLTAPDCALQIGVCAGAKRECLGADGWGECLATDSYGDDFEESESTCDGLDNDCDGTADEGCECSEDETQSCGSDVGACESGTQTCTAGAWGACAGSVEPVEETCNGVDDDCDTRIDEDLTAPSCALVDGVCSGATQSCDGAAGWGTCDADDYGTRYESDESSCDGFDNDCDAVVDEGCPCVVGATQPCGSSVGACERGIQTCTETGWGTCEGDVGPTDEECNGIDDDCNGTTDDNLGTPPLCELQSGVCSGATQECGGSSGWLACSGTVSYGSDYVSTESGGTDESVCDGLDNDCDGTADEGCITGPLVTRMGDAVAPAIYDRHVVFAADVSSDREIFLYDLRTEELTRLTDTSEDEGWPHVYGNLVAFHRGDYASERRVVLYDLESGTETEIAGPQAQYPRVFRNLVVWEDARDFDWDVYMYDVETGTESAIAATIDDEFEPDIRGDYVVYRSDDGFASEVRLHELSTGDDTAQGSGSSQFLPQVDFTVFGWGDGLSVSDMYGATLSSPGSDSALSTATDDQIPNDVSGTRFVWSDRRSGDWDVGMGTLSGSERMLTNSDGSQSNPAISGGMVVWNDSRNGSFDIYAAWLDDVRAATASDVRINELLADPPAGDDVNGDGTADPSEDEFVELVNVADVPVDISGFTISDEVGERHVVPDGTIIPARGALVVFGAGAPSGRFGGVRVQVASSGLLGMNNGGDTITLSTPSGTMADQLAYGSEGGEDEALVRDPEYSGSFTQHGSVTGADGVLSPGTMVTGYGF